MEAVDLRASTEERSLLLVFYSDKARALNLAESLPEREYDVVLSPASASGRWLQELQPDLILLDPPVERDDMLEACERLRSSCDRPLVVLSEQREELAIARAFSAGIDEYLVLPIGGHELAARLDAMLRRMKRGRRQGDSPSPDGMVLSTLDLSAQVDGRKIFLSPTEFRLLSCLASAPGKVLTHDTLMSRVWGAEYVDSRHYLHLYIRYLREKLEADPTKPELIISEWGVGYRFQPPLQNDH